MGEGEEGLVVKQGMTEAEKRLSALTTTTTTETGDYHSCADDNSIRSLQSRPLPDPRSSDSFAEQFHSVASEVDRTLVDSQQQNNNRGIDDDEEHTLAESIVDSMHSCADDTFKTAGEATELHSCADTLEGEDDDVASLRDVESPTPPASPTGTNK